MNAPLQGRFAALRDAAAASGGRDVVAVAAEDLQRIRSPQGATAQLGIDIGIDVAGRALRLRVALAPTFPRALPDIYLLDHDAEGFLAHVHAETGWVCYLSSEGISISRRDPGAVISFAIMSAVGVLDDAIAGRSRRDIADEIAAYWRQYADKSPAVCFVAPGDAVKTIEYTVEHERVQYVADTMRQVGAFFPAAPLAPVRTGVYVPLAASVRDDELDPRAFATMERLRDLLDRHVSIDQRHELERLLERSRTPRLFLLGVPRTDGSRALVAVRCASPRRGQRLLEHASARANRLVAIERCDAEYVRERGGAQPHLQRAHVVLLGCGSVGGHLALALSFSGVGRITLIDPEVMSVDNTFRHVLGRAAHGHHKATALAEEIKKRLPEVTVDALAIDAATAIDRGLLARSDLDLVVVAIGNPSESRHLNEVLRASAIPAVFTWLEPMGIGGHALAMVPGAPGCYECLFADNDGSERLAARTDFAAAGQKFSRDLAGCATTFTPYADLDARRTAELAAHLAVELLSKSETASALVCWRGDARAFESAGFAMSPRWELSDEALRAIRHSFASTGCPLCTRIGE